MPGVREALCGDLSGSVVTDVRRSLRKEKWNTNEEKGKDIISEQGEEGEEKTQAPEEVSKEVKVLLLCTPTKNRTALLEACEYRMVPNSALANRQRHRSPFSRAASALRRVEASDDDPSSSHSEIDESSCSSKDSNTNDWNDDSSGARRMRTSQLGLGFDLPLPSPSPSKVITRTDNTISQEENIASVSSACSLAAAAAAATAAAEALTPRGERARRRRQLQGLQVAADEMQKERY